MKEITIKTDKYLYTEMASRSQNVHQCDNFCVSLHKIGKAIIFTADDCSYTSEYVLDASEKREAIEDPDLFLEKEVAEWALNCDNQAVESIAWGLDDPNDLVVDDCSDIDIDVEVIKIEHYAGYAPVSSIGQYNNFLDAKKAIDEDCPNGTYYLSHGEQERPSYYIIKG